MALSIPDRVLVLDYGEVISRPPSHRARTALAAVADVPLETFEAAYEQHRLELDAGTLSVVGYWTAIGRLLGRSWSLPTIQQLWALDFTSWLDVEPDVVDLLVELHDGGTRLALLSNAGFDFGDPFRTAPWSTLMERIYLSAELGIVKPDPAIYQHVLDDLGIDSSDMVFVDNLLVNVEGATSLGITGHHFTGVPGFRAFLEGLAQ
ncbi:HAD family phosphatase [Nocardioides sp. C4-1]|uniref:HAD family hydrolase n=1 Tax=Nocardioides sp. C4-1 TaxID=3151851 RepID=UPI003266E454